MKHRLTLAVATITALILASAAASFVSNQPVERWHAVIQEIEPPFRLELNTSSVVVDMQEKSLQIDGRFYIDESPAVPEGDKYLGFSFNAKLSDGDLWHRNMNSSDSFVHLGKADFSYLESYYNYNDVYYTTFASIPQDTDKEFRLRFYFAEKPSQFIIYFGTGSTVVQIQNTTAGYLINTSAYNASTANNNISGRLGFLNATGYSNWTGLTGTNNHMLGMGWCDSATEKCHTGPYWTGYVSTNQPVENLSSDLMFQLYVENYSATMPFNRTLSFYPEYIRLDDYAPTESGAWGYYIKLDPAPLGNVTVDGSAILYRYTNGTWDVNWTSDAVKAANMFQFNGTIDTVIWINSFINETAFIAAWQDESENESVCSTRARESASAYYVTEVLLGYNITDGGQHRIGQWGNLTLFMGFISKNESFTDDEALTKPAMQFRDKFLDEPIVANSSDSWTTFKYWCPATVTHNALCNETIMFNTGSVDINAIYNSTGDELVACDLFNDSATGCDWANENGTSDISGNNYSIVFKPETDIAGNATYWIDLFPAISRIIYIGQVAANNTNTTEHNISINATFTSLQTVDTCLIEIYNGSAVNYTGVLETNATGGNCTLNSTQAAGSDYRFKSYQVYVGYNGWYNSTGIRYITIDTVLPQVRTDNPINLSGNSSGISINGTVFDNNNQSCWVNDTTYYAEFDDIYIDGYFNFSNSTGLVEGNYAILITCNDTANNQNSSEVFFTFDITQPNVSIDSPANLTFNNSGRTINGTYLEANNDSCYTNSTYFSTIADMTSASGVFNLSNTTRLVEAQYTVLISCNDTANNTNSSQTTFTFDITKPNVTIDSPGNLSFNSSERTINGTAPDANLGYCWTNDTTAFNNYTDVSTTNGEFNISNTSTLINDTQYTVIITCNDSANHTNSSQITFTFDITNPRISTIERAPACLPAGSPITYRWTAIDEVGIAYHACNFTNPSGTSTIAGGTGAECTKATIASELGTWKISIQLNDSADNWVVANSTFEAVESGACSGGTEGGGGGGVIFINVTENFTISTKLPEFREVPAGRFDIWLLTPFENSAVTPFALIVFFTGYGSVAWIVANKRRTRQKFRMAELAAVASLIALTTVVLLSSYDFSFMSALGSMRAAIGI